MKHFLLLFLLGITVVSGIIRPGGGGWDYGGGGGGGGHHHSHSSSEEHGYGGGHHGPRPPRPRPPRPPRPARCPSDWMTFDRTAGTWCVKVFFGQLTQWDAESQCQTHGATLTGLQDANERMQVADAGRIVNNQNGGGFGEVWLGATRKTGCNRRTDCAPNDTFQWTDDHTTGTAGFYYPGLEPNAVVWTNWGNQNCLELHVSVSSGARARYGYSHGDLDDQHCQQTEVRMYACGKSPE
ncbi:hypothetical protein GCK72_003456 [Caenorhabditis remanei]|uniref:C-type lectin domain-containing protein n=1 Tax=Caenorhabditis remanei TaxID=31234 RepID=A0A6A5HV01_CAERE|nr:hypothetical protein GCK72_003456 [Caenorhabditis remanei]KAF1771629.1 hypothetical protein GCK72_003456 [Caenorhabditis remanei]